MPITSAPTRRSGGAIANRALPHRLSEQRDVPSAPRLVSTPLNRADGLHAARLRQRAAKPHVGVTRATPVVQQRCTATHTRHSAFKDVHRRPGRPRRARPTTLRLLCKQGVGLSFGLVRPRPRKSRGARVTPAAGSSAWDASQRTPIRRTAKRAAGVEAPNGPHEGASHGHQRYPLDSASRLETFVLVLAARRTRPPNLAGRWEFSRRQSRARRKRARGACTRVPRRTQC